MGVSASDLFIQPNQFKKRKIFTLCVNNYFPELMAYTLPSIERYAQKIGAEFHVITERKYPEFPPTYEKMQVYELGADSQWNLFLDADIMVRKDAPDVMVDEGSIGLFAGFTATDQFRPDIYFARDRRNRGISGFMVLSSWLTHDLWTPLEFPWEVAKNNLTRHHCIDEYCISRNLSKYGLRYWGLVTLEPHMDYKFFHLGAAVEDASSKDGIIAKAKQLYESGEY